MKLPKLAIGNYQFTIILVVLLVLSGMTALVRMPKSEDPAVSKPGASVFVIYPGATPADIEELVVDPIEEVLNELDDIKKLESRSQDGLGVISIEFMAGSDPDEKYSDVTEKINTVRDRMPGDIFSLETMKWTISDTNFLQLALVSETAGYREMEKQAERLEKMIKKIKGVKRAQSWAFPRQEIRVSLNFEKLAQLKISLDRVLGAVQAANANIPGGTIDAGMKRFSIKTSGSYESLDQLKHTVVHSDGNRVVYLGDVAQVRLDYEDNNYFARFKGKRCVFVTANQKEGTNIFDIVSSLHTKLEAFKKELPSSMALHTVYDQSYSVQNRIRVFLSNLIQGIVLVGLVILAVIGIRGAFVVMLAIPFSILIALGFLAKSGYGIQQITIAGLVITLGLLVDNAIVVVENITRFIKKGESNLDAAIKGTSQIGWAIVSATATTILAFLPIVMMRDVSGEFIRSMPLTVILTLTASLFIALSFTPYLSSRFLRPHLDRKQSRLMTAIEGFVENRYSRWLDYSLRKPRRIIGLAVLFLVGSLALFPLVGVSFFPKAEKRQFFIDVNLPDGTGISKTDQVVRHVEAFLSARPEVESYTANVGRGNPRIYYNIMEKRRRSNIGQLFVKLKEETANGVLTGMVRDIRTFAAQYPGAKIEVKELEQGPPINAPVEIKVRGEKLEILNNIAGDLEKMFQEIPGLININNPLSTVKTDLHVKINRDKAAMYGIPLANIDRTIRMSIAGISVSSYRDRDGKEYDIVFRADFDKKPTLDIFDKIYVTSATGGLIPLNQLAILEMKQSSSLISHYMMDRSVSLTADVLGQYAVNTITREVVEGLGDYNWPVGYDYVVGGEKEGQDEAFGGMGEAVLIAIIAIFAVLVLQFRSFTQPLIVYAALPLAVIGSILTLLVTGYTFSFTAFVGLTSLVGIVVNNSIILVDYTNQLRSRGMEVVDAVKKAAQTRFTPILLTTVTTMGGLLPLTLQGGSLWAPMGWTIIGGLLTSTVLTLIVVPVLYKGLHNYRSATTVASTSKNR